MTETVTSLLPFRTTMPVLLAGCTRHSERPSLSGGGAGGYRLYGIPPFLPASASVWETGYP